MVPFSTDPDIFSPPPLLYKGEELGIQTSIVETDPYLDPSSNQTEEKKQSEFSINRRVVKASLKLINTLTKTTLMTGQRKTTVYMARRILSVAKQVLAISKVAKTVFTFSRESLEEKWTTKVYHWTNMVQALIVGTITLAPLYNRKYNKGSKIIAGACFARSAIKLIDLTTKAREMQDSQGKTIYLFKISRAILSLAGSIFALIGTTFLSKEIMLITGLAVVILGISKSFYKLTRQDPLLLIH